jgi:uncharacterized membrane protein YeaQ/YmgE (transglycosylase-associated protein family)
MQVFLLVVGMLAVGLLISWLAGPIWKDNRPIGVTGDTVVAIVVAVAIGLMDWFVVPAMGFSDTLKYLGVAIEPALGALLVLWIIRRAKKSA